MAFLIPLGSEKLQSLNFTHDGFSFTMILRWNEVFRFWNIDLYDNLKLEWVVKSESLEINALSCVQLDMPFGFSLLDDSDSGSPDIEKTGSDVNLYIVNKEDYYAAIRQSI